MAATFKDMDQLRLDLTFQGRVRAALISLALGASAEAWSVPFHRERQMFAVQILNSPDAFVNLFASSIATDATVIADATQGGTVAITGANVAAQQALVTDAHITAALTAQVNSYLKAPFA
jgi:hypothetical protein